MSKPLSFLLILALALFSTSASAGLINVCFNKAASRFDLDPMLLMAMGIHESNLNPVAVSPVNKNGFRDYGMMQKNGKYMGPLFEAGFQKEDLFDPCTSIYVAAFDLKECVKTYGSTWRAVGCYNAWKGPKQEAARQTYANKVRAIYNGLRNKRRTQGATNE